MRKKPGKRLIIYVAKSCLTRLHIRFLKNIRIIFYLTETTKTTIVMRKAPLIIACSITAISVISFACNSETKTKEKNPVDRQSELIARGEYLVATIGCDDCHSPKRMGAKGPELIQELRLSGYPSDRPVHDIDTAAL